MPTGKTTTIQLAEWQETKGGGGPVTHDAAFLPLPSMRPLGWFHRWHLDWGRDGAARGGSGFRFSAGAWKRHDPKGVAEGWETEEEGGEEDTVKTWPPVDPPLGTLTTPLNIFSLCQTGGWRTSCWKWNTKASTGHRRWESGSALAASRPWVWSSAAAISAWNASCASATTAEWNYPTPASGSATCAPRSRKAVGSSPKGVDATETVMWSDLWTSPSSMRSLCSRGLLHSWCHLLCVDLDLGLDLTYPDYTEPHLDRNLLMMVETAAPFPPGCSWL